MKRAIYLLTAITIGLVSLTIYSTHAMFTSSVSSDTVLNLDTTINYEFAINGVKRFTLDAKTTLSFNMTIKNNTSKSLKYGIYHNYTGNGIVKIGEVVADATTVTTATNTTGTLTSSQSKTIPVAIVNETSNTITIDIGLVTDESSLTYPTNASLITSTVDDDELGTGACASRINYQEEDCYNVKESGYINTYCTALVNSSTINNLDTSGANIPELADGMIPIRYNGSTWVKADSTNSNSTHQWYDYNAKKWANAVMINNSFLYDKSGSGNNSLVSGATSSTAGLTFDGSDDYVQIPTNLGVTLPATYTVRFKTTSTANQVIFGDYTTKAALGLYSSNSSLIVILGSTATNIFNTGGLSLNTFYTVTLVYNSLTDVKAYLNGVELTKSTSTNNWSWGDTNSYIGKRSAGTYFAGTISNFIVHNKAVTTSEVTSLANNQVPTDSLKLNYDFTTTTRSQFMDASLGTIVPEDAILAYYVWIPRYKYQLFNVESTTMDPIEIQVTFEGKNVTKSSGTANGEWLTHPAFTLGTDELEGIWVGKFSTTGSAETPTVKPNIGMLTNQNVSTQFTTSQIFGTTTYLTSTGVSEVDAHMMKNIEWGAVAYLKQSKYGLGTTDIGLNNYSSSPYLTGCGSTSGSAYSTTCNAYNTTDGMLASTTGNITGIYDMSAAMGTYVMGVMKTSNGTALTYSSSGFTTSTLPFNSKYVDQYEYGGSINDYTRRILGDATGEVNGWYGDIAGFVLSAYPWFFRGNSYVDDPAGAGVFTFRYNVGKAGPVLVFRSVLAPGA